MHCLIAIAALLLAACVTSPVTGPAEQQSKVQAQKKLVITAVGDIMLGGTAAPELRKFGYDYPFVNVKPLLQESDITFGNLEGPLTDGGHAEVEKKYLFRSPPDKVAPALARAGFDVVSLANNHAIDYGIEGLKDTIRALQDAKIHYVGAGLDLAEARKAVVIEKNDTRVAFLAYSLTFPEEFWATSDQAGTAFGHLQHVKRDVAEQKQHVDIVVVSFHWGREGTTELRDYQTALGRAAIDSGATLVIGHHPHILQGIERYGDGIIFYSLGNFIFGSYSRTAQRSVIAQMTIVDKTLSEITLVPINVNNFDMVFQPQILRDEESIKVLVSLQQLSEQSGVVVDIVNGAGKIILK